MSEDLTGFTAEIADQVESFVLAVREISTGQSPDHAISLLLLEVSQLMLAGGRLGAINDVVPEERFEPDPGGDPDVEGVRDALARLLEPIDEFREVFDPYAAEPEVLVTRLSDDIAGIVSDLAHGLAHYRRGRSLEALWWWQFSYLSNWGGTAGSVLRALHSVVSHVRLDATVDDEVAEEDRLLAEVSADALGVGGDER
ncbi:DUF5063 domain-containing protein [Vallicoccus soli]|uniref:DUF5063 domain-containing protein n=1 Tax=Vallicoccus soli TaxID=2339232 RepID=A0A3A3Z404_9ACTN|nr:DUF5063 domain-containing protein [Vallicoccus soli]RJK97648.1 DUF5063 domain-containing protein [Vallicoccus soli]